MPKNFGREFYHSQQNKTFQELWGYSGGLNNKNHRIHLTEHEKEEIKIKNGNDSYGLDYRLWCWVRKARG